MTNSLAVNPRDHMVPLVLWSTINFFVIVAHTCLFGVSIQLPSRNALLLHLEANFVVTYIGVTALIWTGHALSKEPPFGICLLNASLVISNVPSHGATVAAMVIQVWARTMALGKAESGFLKAMSYTPMLLIIPYVASIPVFFAALIVGLRNPDSVYRASPFYCDIDNAGLQWASNIMGGTFTLLILVLVIITTTVVVRVRRRTKVAGPSRASGGIYLLIRITFFVVSTVVAFVVGLVSIFVGFSTINADIVLSASSFAAFIIFGSSKDIVQFAFCCKKDNHTGTIGSASQLRSAHFATSAIKKSSHYGKAGA